MEELDLSAEFFNHVLSKDYINSTLKKVEKLLDNDEIKDFYEKYQTQLNNLPLSIESAVSVLKEKKYFYDASMYIKSNKVINLALRLISMSFYPLNISLRSYREPNFNLNFENLKKHILSREKNIYYNYYAGLIEKIKSKEISYVGITVNAESQLTGGLTLAYFIKKYTDAFVNIGGTFFSRIEEELKTYPELFELFTDSITIGEGEKTILDIVRFIKHEIEIDKIDNLVYLKNQEVINNKKSEYVDLNKVKSPVFKNSDFSKYFLPEPVLPLQAQRGCYWRKCTFCSVFYHKSVTVKDISILINEIKYYTENLGITKFEFVDEAMHPSYLARFSNALIENKLKINYFISARLEEQFTKKIFRTAYKSGLKMIMWGLETGSPRIHNLINKGVDFNNRMMIMKDASDEGIWNHSFLFTRYPSETFEDAEMTINMLKKNNNIIDSSNLGIFGLDKHSSIYKNIGNNPDIEMHDFQPLFASYYNCTSRGMSNQEYQKILEMYKSYLTQKPGYELINKINSYSHLFLFICKYGRKQLKNYKRIIQ